MDNIGIHNIEFIDLSDVEEKERNWIINSLHTWDPNVKVPWKRNIHRQPPVKLAAPSVPFQYIPNNLEMVTTCIASPNMILAATNNDSRDRSNIIYNQQIYPMYQVSPVYPANIPTAPSNNLHNIPTSPPNNLHQTVPSNNLHNIQTNNLHNIPTSSSNALPYQKQTTYLNTSYASSVNATASYSHQLPNAFPALVLNNDANFQTYTNTSRVDISNKIEQNGTNNEQPLNNSKYMEESNVVVENSGPSFYINHESHTPSVTQFKESVPKSSEKSWASLFSQARNVVVKKEAGDESINKPFSEVAPFIKDTSNAVVNNESGSKNDSKSNYNDPVFFILGEYLTEYTLDHRTISLQPRGLINRSNYCYINSILQALLACPPVYNLLNSLSEKITTVEMKKVIPVIDHMVTFVKEFQYLPAGQRVSRRVDKNQKQDPNLIINCDTPFEPTYIYKMLNGMRSDTFVIEGRQEDAEEFLGCLLNGLNDEMLELMKLVDKKINKPTTDYVNIENDGDKEWQVMGPKNKGCVTRRTEVIQTPISDIFNGHLRSRVHRTGDKSTDNIQPFFTLQLNIEKVSTVKEALEALVCRNQLEGVTSSKTNEEVEAWQQVTIEELPYVLILHLKCFDFKLDGCTKILKALEFPIDLKMDSKLLSSKTNYSPKEKQYKLFAVVYHDGKEATKGHYITDAYHVGYARWIRYDDASIKAVPEEQVLKPHGTRVPYLLFYRRSDSIRSK